MDPASAYWQAKLSAVARNLSSELHIQGLYVDQIGCAPAMPCAGEVLGDLDTARWTRGYRAMLLQIHAQLEKGAALMSEAQAEVYSDLVDVNLAIYGLDRCNHIPIYQYIYAGWTQLMGTRNWGYTNNNTFDTVRACMAVGSYTAVRILVFCFSLSLKSPF